MRWIATLRRVSYKGFRYLDWGIMSTWRICQIELLAELLPFCYTSCDRCNYKCNIPEKGSLDKSSRQRDLEIWNLEFYVVVLLNFMNYLRKIIGVGLIDYLGVSISTRRCK